MNMIMEIIYNSKNWKKPSIFNSRQRIYFPLNMGYIETAKLYINIYIISEFYIQLHNYIIYTIT